ncbi:MULTISPECIES: DUF4232 domain-containing protein [Streptosporangium]|uniref:DUF4232 domain-containing protein n=1 Tax=Streptosporangium brasiliense TaxID=47480 RepID=A0ABT9QZU5_9ACTN|nr:DUF4232 domain-containing protein [Streptosporangium brasiliense]MDP9862117.1 hypothetical protein [Streptosporangium brasiliense]
MKRSNGAGRLAALSTVMAAVLTVSAACGSPAPSGQSGQSGQDSTPARASAAGAAVSPAADVRPADTRAGAGVRPAGAGAGTGTGTRSTGAGSTAAGTEAAESGSSTAGSAVGRCRTEALAARIGPVDAGAGQRYAPLVVTNGSTRTCWVYGFAGLIMIDRDGDALRTRTRRENVRPRRVTLRPGAGAHARIHWTEVPSGGERRCPVSARLMIIPPDEVAHLEIPFTARVCDDGRLDITPMAPGTRL